MKPRSVLRIIQPQILTTLPDNLYSAMFPLRMAVRAVRPSLVFTRPLSSTPQRLGPSISRESKTLGEITQKGEPELTHGEMGVGEMEGAEFKIEPLHRSGEDPNTMRARLLCSRHLHYQSNNNR